MHSPYQGFLWRENEESMFWSFYQLADKTNIEQITETIFQGHMKIALTLLSPMSDQSQFSPHNNKT